MENGKGVMVFEVPGSKPIVPGEEKGEGDEETGRPASELAPADGLLGFTGGADRDIVVWELKAGTPSKKMAGHTAEVRTVVLASDGGS